MELRFAELQPRAPGIRKVNVVIQGTQVMFNYDIAAEVGPFFADNHVFTTIVCGDGTLRIRLVDLRGFANSMINALRIIQYRNPIKAAGIKGEILIDRKL